MKKKLEAKSMEDLRALGYDLEPLLEREIRSTRKAELAAEIVKALEELADEEPETVEAILESHGLADGAESTESDSPEPDEEAGEEVDEEPETPDEEPETADSEESEAADSEEVEEEPLPYAIQIREHSTKPGLYYGEIIVNPDRETVDSVIHAKLSEEGVKKLAARGTRIRK